MNNPANKMVHWNTGPFKACEKHAQEMVELGKTLGSYIAISTIAAHKVAECETCIKEGK